MFKGSWKESSADVIKLDIPDDNITQEGKNIRSGHTFFVNVRNMISSPESIRVAYRL